MTQRFYMENREGFHVIPISREVGLSGAGPSLQCLFLP